ncbi:hypothetical protein JCM8097_004216 [Rhodosporidiobolus ruineniae]
MSGGLHRRTSSAALYQPLTPQPGGPGDIADPDTLESYSSSLSQPRRGSLAAQQRALEELEEKEGFIPDSAYDLPGQGGAGRWRDSRNSSGSQRSSWLGWKSRLVLFMLVGGGIGGGIYYLFYRETGLWWDAPTSREELSEWAKTAATSAGESAATGVAHYAEQQYEADGFDEEAQFYSNEEAGEYSSLSSASKPGSKTTSAVKASSTTARTTFGEGTSEDVAKLLENGTLSAYRWHELLPPLNGTGSTTITKQDGGRLIIVGDIHGTYTSFRRLLRRLSFNPSHDTLLHTGDIITKSSLSDSLATISLLRRLGVKGVRGNHDQKVLEWRKWMEAYGPLDGNSSSSSASPAAALKGVQDTVAAVGGKAQTGFRVAGGAVKDSAKSGFRKVASSHSNSHGQAVKLDAVAPRSKTKRGWLDWLTGNEAAGDDGSEELFEEVSSYGSPVDEEFGAAGGKDAAAAGWADEDAVDDGPGWDDLKLAGEAASSASERSASSASRSSASSAASSTSTGGGLRRPFGRPTSLSSSSPSSSSSSRSRASSSTASSTRPSSTASSRLSSLASSLSASGANSTLLTPSYAWLSPSSTPAQLKKLGVEVPEGWEWGGDHFELARHLEKEDVEYLEGLPLTLWVEEIKSWVVHAGMVPWSSLPTTLSASSSSSSSSPKLPSILESTSPLSFAPSTSLSKLLTRSPLTSLLLEPLNTDPYTLQNMRTLHGHAASADPYAKTKAGTKVKGPGRSWEASSKGRKAGAGSRPWWSVWEEGMRKCAKEREDECEPAGIVYGHWAGQGLQVQEHSIGLDSGCVYGRRLSALVVPLSPSSNSSSPLSTRVSTSSSLLSSGATAANHATSPSADLSAGANKLKGAASSLVSESLSSASASTTETASTTTSRAKAKWNGGLHRVTKSASSALSSATASATASDESASAGSAYEYDLADEDALPTPTAAAEKKPWWRPWSAAALKEKEKKKLARRAPPQGRPGTAPWEDREVEELVEDDEEREEEAYEVGEGYEEEYEEEEEATSSSTSTKGAKGRPTKTSASSASASSTDKLKAKLKSTASSVSSRLSVMVSSADSAAPTRATAFAAASFDKLNSLLSTASDGEKDEELDESAFAEKVVYLAQAASAAKGKKGGKEKGVKAWVVSVECLGEGSSAE